MSSTLRIGVLGNEGSWYVADLTRAATERGHICQRMEFRELLSCVTHRELNVRESESSLSQLDALIVRTMPPGSLEQVVYRMDVLLMLESQGILVINPPRAVECAVDKFLTTAKLQQAGLPTPRTVVCENSDSALAAFEELGGDIVLKPLFGAEGRGIMRISQVDEAFRVFRNLERMDAVLYLQEFIDHPGYDVRVLVLDGNVLGAIRRASPDDFRTNVSRQATATCHIPTDKECIIAIQAANAVGASIAGVDLLYDRQGNCFVIEVNAVPGWQAFRKATKIDVADKLIESLEHQHES